jgi:hypothetical protein
MEIKVAQPFECYLLNDVPTLILLGRLTVYSGYSRYGLYYEHDYINYPEEVNFDYAPKLPLITNPDARLKLYFEYFKHIMKSVFIYPHLIKNLILIYV